MSGRRTYVGTGIVVAVLTALAVAVLVGPVSAAKNPNKLEVTLQDFPGPTEVTFGGNVASSLKVSNPSNNPWNKVLVTAPAPETQIAGQALPEKSTLVHLNGCPAGALKSGSIGSSAPVVCNLGTLDPRGAESYTLLLVWKVPSAGSSAGCTGCLKNLPVVTGSEGTSGPDGPPSSHDDSFTPVVETKLLDSPDKDKEKAGTYVMERCDTAGETSLETNQAVGKGNQIASAFCAPDLRDDLADPGLVVSILERGSNPSEQALGIRTQIAEICAPDLRFAGPDPNKACEPGYVPFDFTSAGLATTTFTIDNKSVKGGPITKVFYDSDEGGTVHSFKELTFTPSATEAYIVSIGPDPADNQKTIVVMKSPGNGWNGLG